MKRQEDGFVAIIMALVIIVLVSLVGLGFAFLASQNQAQSQNRILSTQAFYAAESGVNDAINYLKTHPGAADNTNCSSTIPSQATDIGSSNTAVKYTCLLYSSAPTSLEYPSLGTNNSRIVRVQAQSGTIASIKISWQAGGGSTTFANSPEHFLPQTSFTTDPLNKTDGNNLAFATGILRTTLIPVYGTVSRTDLTTRSQTLFLYPNQNTTGTSNVVTTQDFLKAASYSDVNQAEFVDGNCNSGSTPKYCNVEIQNLDRDIGSGAGTGTFYLRLKPIYQTANVTVTAKLTDGTQAKLINEQATIDATGKANDVLRRIQVRVPLSTSNTYPEFAVETVDSLCKRLQVWNNGANISWQNIPGATTQPTSCTFN